MRRIVIVVDTQGDFMAADGALSVAGADALVAPMQGWLAALSPADTAAVLFTFDTHETAVYPGSAEAKAFPLHCVRGTVGWNNLLTADMINPAIPAYRLEKGVFAMWQEDGLLVEDARDPAAPLIPREAFFRALRDAGVDRATVIGVAADYCVRWAIDGLVARGFTVSVPAALTRGIERQIDQVVAEDFAGQAVAVT